MEEVEEGSEEGICNEGRKGCDSFNLVLVNYMDHDLVIVNDCWNSVSDNYDSATQEFIKKMFFNIMSKKPLHRIGMLLIVHPSLLDHQQQPPKPQSMDLAATRKG